MTQIASPETTPRSKISDTVSGTQSSLFSLQSLGVHCVRRTVTIRTPSAESPGGGKMGVSSFKYCSPSLTPPRPAAEIRGRENHFLWASSVEAVVCVSLCHAKMQFGWKFQSCQAVTRTQPHGWRSSTSLVDTLSVHNQSLASILSTNTKYSALAVRILKKVSPYPMTPISR